MLPDGVARRYYHKDLLGSTRAAVIESGLNAEQAACDPWGVRNDGRPEVSRLPGAREGLTGKPRPTSTGGGIVSRIDDFGASWSPATLRADPTLNRPLRPAQCYGSLETRRYGSPSPTPLARLLGLILATCLLATSGVPHAQTGPPPFPASVGVVPPTNVAFPTDTGRAWGGASLDRSTLPESAFRSVEPVVARRILLDDALYAIGSQVGLPIMSDGLAGRVADVETPAGTAIDALIALASREGLTITEEGGVLRIVPALPEERAPDLTPSPESDVLYSPPNPHSATTGADGVSVSVGADGVALVSLSVEDAPVTDVLRDLARQAGLNVVTTTATDARVTARWDRVPVDEALRLLLLGTPLTSRREGATVVVADRQLPGMLTSRLIRLRHIPAPGILERLPEPLRREATFQLIQEQNALLVTAPADIVAATEAFVRQIDQEPAQILLEVLVVEFETSGLKQIGVSFLGGLLPDDPNAPVLSGPGRAAYVFGGGDDQRGGLDLVGDATIGDRALNFWKDVLGIRSIGHLPSDFYFRLQALERAGRAQVRSRPHIATLNGNTASISVGTSQYYILKSSYGYGPTGPFGGGGDAERFEYVRADVQLEITPYVTEGDPGDQEEITAVIRPTFATPVGAFDPRVPPTIRSWSVDTSVRLRDGETFMIGGLVQDNERVVENRVPILGRLPLIGRLFRNSARERSTGELVIFITPHVLSDDRSDLTDRPHLAPHTARDAEGSPRE